jgi:DNA-binding PadR family transcriptional regulator
MYSDNQLELNIGLILLLLEPYNKSLKEKYIIDNNKALTYLCLIKNPVLLNFVLKDLGIEGIELQPSENYSISSLSPDTDSLFDRDSLKTILKQMARLGLISVKFKESKGFYYVLTERGEHITLKLESDYYQSIRNYLKKINEITNLSMNKLNLLINNILKRI